MQECSSCRPCTNGQKQACHSCGHMQCELQMRSKTTHHYQEWANPFCSVCQNQKYTLSNPHPHIWVPAICTDAGTASQKKNRQMETKVQGWNLPGSLTIPCKHSAPHPIYTGDVSPQFHVSFDDLFETINGKSMKIRYEWQKKAGIVANKSISFVDVNAGRLEAMYPLPYSKPRCKNSRATIKLKRQHSKIK